MPNGSNQPPSYGAKNLGDYRDLGRGSPASFYRRLAAASGFPPSGGVFARLGAFTSQFKNWGAWIEHVLRHAGGGKHPFQRYEPTETGIFIVPNQLQLSIAGDWGTGTDESKHVTDQMKTHNPDYTIHLGDVYYVGDPSEIEEHCLGRQAPKSMYAPVAWQRGSQGSFALNGNHEMYALGTAYFEEFLPTLGPIDAATDEAAGQHASYFCLKNKYWKVIGLDTGYYSTGFSSSLSFLSKIKFIKWFRKTTWFKPSCKLPDEMMQWLPGVMKRDADGPVQGLILLSHHQYYSGFDDWYVTPAQQIEPLISGRTVLWFWGHEHRMAIYDQFAAPTGINAFGRCIGHGGMPVSRGIEPDIKDCNCVLYDDRKYPNNEEIDVGYNGYVNFTFDGPGLRVDYFDLHNTLLLTENWSVDKMGQLDGPKFSNVNPDPNLVKRDLPYIKNH